MPEKPIPDIIREPSSFNSVTFPSPAVTYLPDAFLTFPYPLVQVSQRLSHSLPPLGIWQGEQPLAELLDGRAPADQGSPAVCLAHMLESTCSGGLGIGPNPDNLSERGDHEW